MNYLKTDFRNSLTDESGDTSVLLNKTSHEQELTVSEPKIQQ
jgi:hypothetical protein